MFIQSYMFNIICYHYGMWKPMRSFIKIPGLSHPFPLRPIGFSEAKPTGETNETMSCSKDIYTHMWMIRVYKHIHRYLCIHIMNIYIYIYIYIYMYTIYIYICICTLYIYICTLYIYIYEYAHTYWASQTSCWKVLQTKIGCGGF